MIWLGGGRLAEHWSSPPAQCSGHGMPALTHDRDAAIMSSTFHSPQNQAFRPAGRPTILLGAQASRLGTIDGIVRDMSEQQFFATDLDLRSTWIAPSWTRVATDASRSMMRVRSAWIAGVITGPAARSRLLRLETLLRGCKDELGLRTIVIPRAAHLRRGSSIGPSIKEIVADRTKASARVAVGIRAIDYANDRRHLDELVATRRMAEEWDLDIALDLTGNVSLSWEAEAAIVRLMPRLTLVRLHSWIGVSGMDRSRERQAIALRTIAMLADQGYAGSISLLPHSALWWSGPAAIGSGPEALARELILDRYDRQTRQAQVLPPHEIRPQDRL